MTGLVFSSVVFAALLHAGWNALVKTGQNKQSGMLLLTLAHAFFGLCILPFVSLPQGTAWLWLIASGLIHMFYQLFLGLAYERGDLSRVYPIARGAAPMIVLIVSLSFGIDSLRGLDLLGILVLGLGIVLMAHGVFSSGEDRRLIPLALGSAAATAGYSLVDGMGARVMGDALAICLMKLRGFRSDDFARVHPGGALGKRLYLRVMDLAKANERPLVKSDASVQAAILEMTQKRLGVTAVVDGEDRLLGIITDGDLRRMLEKGMDWNGMKALDIMTPSTKTIEADALAVEALEVLQDHSITQLVVTAEGRYIGIVHLHDLVREGLH